VEPSAGIDRAQTPLGQRGRAAPCLAGLAAMPPLTVGDSARPHAQWKQRKRPAAGRRHEHLRQAQRDSAAQVDAAARRGSAAEPAFERASEAAAAAQPAAVPQHNLEACNAVDAATSQKYGYRAYGEETTRANGREKAVPSGMQPGTATRQGATQRRANHATERTDAGAAVAAKCLEGEKRWVGTRINPQRAAAMHSRRKTGPGSYSTAGSRHRARGREPAV
jgi:hypothetical protein